MVAAAKIIANFAERELGTAPGQIHANLAGPLKMSEAPPGCQLPGINLKIGANMFDNALERQGSRSTIAIKLSGHGRQFQGARRHPGKRLESMHSASELAYAPFKAPGQPFEHGRRHGQLAALTEFFE